MADKYWIATVLNSLEQSLSPVRNKVILKQGEIMPSTQALQKQIAQLPALDRIAPVEDILQGLDAPDAAVDALWASEAESRLAAYKSGQVKAIPLSEVLAKYKL